MRNRKQYGKGWMGPAESNFFAWVQMRRQPVVRSGDLSPVLGLSPVKERDLLSRLSRAGWIVRLRRGLYLAPLSLPAGGSWNPPESVVIPALMREIRGQYQICGPNAFNRYGFDSQVPNCVFVYNSRLSCRRQIGSTRYVFIRLSRARLGAVEEIRTPDGTALRYSSRLRTLLDALYDWSVFNGIPRAFTWIRQEMRERPNVAGELARLTVRFGNQATLRRMGYLLQQAGASKTTQARIRKALRDSVSLVTLVPAKARRGPVIKEWGLIDNERA